MIGKGAQYLTAAGFGRYRITAASLGRDVMFAGWLSGRAWKAIMDAFGVDGTAVIRATNEYLNGIAASDKAKATALAWFINEDPMMVCSLGLEPQGVTMPVRWLVGDGVAYIDLEYYPLIASADLKAEIQVRRTANQQDTNILGAYNNSQGRCFPFAVYSNRFFYGIYGTNVGLGSGPAMDINTSYNVRVEYSKANGTQKMYVNDVLQLSSSYAQSVNVETNWLLFARRENTSVNCKFTGDVARLNVVEGTVGKILLAPCKHNGQNGMYDIERMRWFGNANSQGSFTIPDISYTPTPLTVLTITTTRASL